MGYQKKRIDQLLVEKGLFPSREQARRSIMAGLVYADNKKIEKPGTAVDSRVNIEIKGSLHPYVSRGGLKLAKALEVFHVDVQGVIAIDVGASTGGFTDCLLQNGAAKVYAVDVGYGQLDWKLRNDPRVVVMERTNIRYLTKDKLDQLADLAVVDVAFISLTKFFAGLLDLLTDAGQIIALIKPQFEVGRELVGKKGVVRDPGVHRQLLLELLGQLQEFGAGLMNIDYSPILGPQGNIEYLAYFGKQASVIDHAQLVEQTLRAVAKDSELNKWGWQG
ncbi:MAG: TlyA family RNA methyltransferase [Firmicutes bacterium]|jgi:23S rRNA (cytidine1920-2'-O)/16S rRNA (cytidine1409-2'-O)-methyltransferase|nr:TlyA family RNA methyltransferase [Bacillota bacterium]NLL88869.1 TlyA family RNA methyltransferase [Bacillota bacterium]